MPGNSLPPHNAFLVQLGEEVDAALGHCAGRVEHLESGRRARFGSRDELFSVLARMLAQRDPAGSKPEPEEK